ncbi:hypothetical protein JTE90_017796 [Oedothorax gibbosus]|uniref:Uncharacterized protein n=1 Tax=Oedothorax gibbosus TaxID=931172 RepID=A0AAV6U6I5_9ARAC|nr:hypothetical protein JTE90_017796 [Oedothorax gibbosus]
MPAPPHMGSALGRGASFISSEGIGRPFPLVQPRCTLFSSGGTAGMQLSGCAPIWNCAPRIAVVLQISCSVERIDVGRIGKGMYCVFF